MPVHETLIVDCPKDGNCLFSSIADQLKFLKRNRNADADEIRKTVVSYLKDNQTDIKDKLGDEQYVALQTVLQEEGGLSMYTEKIIKDGEWGEGIVLIASSLLYGHIEVHYIDDSSVQPVHLGRDFSDSDSSVIRLGFSKASSHYVSIRTESAVNESTAVNADVVQEETLFPDASAASQGEQAVADTQAHDEPPTSTSFTAESRKNISDNSSTHRKFRTEWTAGRSWLRYDPVSKLMFCTMCEKARLENTFVRGCHIMKKESVTKHEKGQGENSHQTSKIIIQGQNTFSGASAVVRERSKDAAIGALKIVHFLAKHNLQNSLMGPMAELCTDLGADQLKLLSVDKHSTYTSNKSVHDFQQALSDCIAEKLIDNAKKASLYSVLIDESTDVSVSQNVLIYIRFLVSVFGILKPETHFLAFRKLNEGATADRITSLVIDTLNNVGLKVENISGIASDGAAVMIGCKSGFVTRMKSCIPGLLAVHCISHRLALAAGNAANSVAYLVKFQEVVNSIYSYFHMSPKNSAKLKAIQSKLCQSEKKFKQVSHTRWLSFEACVDAMSTNYTSLLTVLKEDDSAKASSLLQNITKYKFLHVLHFLLDALQKMAYLCKLYQSSSITFVDVEAPLRSSIKFIASLEKENRGEKIRQFLQSIPSTPENPEAESEATCGQAYFVYDGHRICDSQKQRTEAKLACSSFAKRLVENLESRFSPDADSTVLAALSSIFHPSVYADNSESLQKFLSLLPTVVEFATTLSLTDCEDHFLIFRDIVKSSRTPSLLHSVDDICQLAFRYDSAVSTVSVLAKRLLTTPVSTVDVERGFSRMALLKTDLRNSLSDVSMQNLMMISLEGPSDKFNYDEAFAKWSTMTTRRLL